ncbi:FAD binding domain-containing protein [Mangrovactinospora gilvigrisea]|nr:FAD binding domain-containing protein [Mangrovactinospora gilvigrisea]
MLPGSLDEAVAALDAVPAAVPVAGGTDLMPAINSGRLRPEALVGLGRVKEMRGWRYLEDGRALLGAGLTLARIGQPDFGALVPALAAAARTAGPPHVRNAATLGGNVVSAAPTADTLPVLVALEAEVTVAGSAGRRDVPVSHLLTGLDPLGPGEVLVCLRVPLLHAPQVYLKAQARTGPSRSAASVAVVLDPARRGVRCAVGGVAPVPLRPLDAEAWVASVIDWDGGRRIAREALAAFGDYVAAACVPEPAGAPRSEALAAERLRRTIAVLARRGLGRALA